MYHINNNAFSCVLIRHTKLIVWDEAPMSHRHPFDALDQTLRDIMETDILFGGKVLLLAGDFRQLLPVVRLGRRALSRSVLWQQCVVLQLHRNMHVVKCGRDEQHAAQLRQHADWLLQLGNGRLPTVRRRYPPSGRAVRVISRRLGRVCFWRSVSSSQRRRHGLGIIESHLMPAQRHGRPHE